MVTRGDKGTAMRLDLVQVAHGVHQARTKYVAWVLIEDGGEVTLVDTGWPADRSRLLASLEGIGRSPADVTALLLTHGHRDHQGSAKWFQSRYGVPVGVHEDERANATGTGGRRRGPRARPAMVRTAGRRCRRGAVELGARAGAALNGAGPSRRKPFGAPGEIRTRTGQDLNLLPLPLGYGRARTV